ncbi:MAG: RNA polymerase sigma factor [Bacteroidota bacterium]
MSAFKDIYRNHSDMVYNLCLNYLQNKEDAEDVTQLVFVKVYQQLDKFQGKSSLKTWIYRIAVNQCLDHQKASKRKKRFGVVRSLFAEKEDQKEVTPIEMNHPGVALEDKEAVSRIFSLINQLAPKQKIALLLKTTEGLSGKEIGEVMNLSEKAVESLLSRARSNLKKMLS